MKRLLLIAIFLMPLSLLTSSPKYNELARAINQTRMENHKLNSKRLEIAGETSQAAQRKSNQLRREILSNAKDREDEVNGAKNQLSSGEYRDLMNKVEQLKSLRV